MTTAGEPSRVREKNSADPPHIPYCWNIPYTESCFSVRRLVEYRGMARSLAFAFVCWQTLLFATLSPTPARGEEPVLVAETESTLEKSVAPACFAQGAFREVWIKVAERNCLKCHTADGDASESEFLLLESARLPMSERVAAYLQNCQALTRMASLKEDDGRARLLVKATGGLDHGGGEVVKADSTELRLLQEFIQQVQRGSTRSGSQGKLSIEQTGSFFDGVEMISDQRLLRRVTLSLAARLPTDEERAAVVKDGLQAIDAILDQVMREDAFYERLQEVFNDILLIRGYDGVAEGALSYEHFKTRLWYQERDPGDISYQDPKKRAYYQLVKDYREGMLREPLELITYIVRNDRPFTEIVTADYIMVSPYTSRGYGIYEELEDKFDDPDDPFEYIPTKIKALRDRRDREVQESPTGFYPHAGLLSSFQYLKRYPTTESNRNRLRVRMYFEHFLGVDIMALAPRVNDAAAITEKYDIPTMQAADCVVCHKVIDPVAGLLQDYYVVDGKGIYGPRKDGWYEDMFPPGMQGKTFPEEERWRSLQWLGEQTAKDPRFAVAMVEHVWYALMGRKPILPPDDIDDPAFAARHRAYREQQDLIHQTATRFAAANFNLKLVFKELVQSRFYRADGVSLALEDPLRSAELDDVGVVRMLTPEQLERKIEAVFGMKWGRLLNTESKLMILYGGIDSKEVTERITTPSGAMGAIQRIMANDVACQTVAEDFSLPPDQRRLFPDIELIVVPGETPEGNVQIRQAIVHLHKHVLGREHALDHPEIERTFQLFAGIVSDAKAIEGLEKRGSYHCDRVDEKRLDDPHYTLRAWRGVVTYLLRQHDFLYE